MPIVVVIADWLLLTEHHAVPVRAALSCSLLAYLVDSLTRGAVVERCPYQFHGPAEAR